MKRDPTRLAHWPCSQSWPGPSTWGVCHSAHHVSLGTRLVDTSSQAGTPVSISALTLDRVCRGVIGGRSRGLDAFGPCVPVASCESEWLRHDADSMRAMHVFVKCLVRWEWGWKWVRWWDRGGGREYVNSYMLQHMMQTFVKIQGCYFVQ